ncbi:hypothetical protein [Vibrio panuliri]|uniref:Uncharacterized protein n=1 Tax=Vibrio panuliri TaxID=1381081 RepID=A0ABX3FGK0_9VIBR|nr:hypothetical protein [Vibrio panuliri]KAB1460851.1 hypothetical protein F7O85_00305 [Vibrio panuliri]OLQ91656.1 hypothetical protein BIY20_09645 [Vibrio panuliri]
MEYIAGFTIIFVLWYFSARRRAHSTAAFVYLKLRQEDECKGMSDAALSEMICKALAENVRLDRKHSHDVKVFMEERNVSRGAVIRAAKSMGFIF